MRTYSMIVTCRFNIMTLKVLIKYLCDFLLKNLDVGRKRERERERNFHSNQKIPFPKIFYIMNIICRVGQLFLFVRIFQAYFSLSIL